MTLDSNFIFNIFILFTSQKNIFKKPLKVLIVILPTILIEFQVLLIFSVYPIGILVEIKLTNFFDGFLLAICTQTKTVDTKSI